MHYKLLLLFIPKSNAEQSGRGYGPYLYIQFDQKLRNLRFVSELGVTHLELYNCQNAHALRVPANLRAFQHYNSALKTVKGVERLVGLEKLYLEDNQIVELNIRGLDKLKVLGVRNNKIMDLIFQLKDLYVPKNKIMDLSGAEYLKAKGCCKERYGIGRQKQPSQEEIDEARLW
ncbi:Leucine-rich_repeat domain superfamily [Hexamita inflata]|uniref:Leucine-rich repeat domain superfamily n=1 Tax=Hexamita inflata TaxID=28002 RepID=A0AA86UAD0_9EUKA|nr:Leucine-rich repeat domain superfamily [Hexamita inflata]